MVDSVSHCRELERIYDNIMPNHARGTFYLVLPSYKFKEIIDWLNTRSPNYQRWLPNNDEFKFGDPLFKMQGEWREYFIVDLAVFPKILEEYL